MPFKVICKDNNYTKTFNDYSSALTTYYSLKNKCSQLSLVEVGKSDKYGLFRIGNNLEEKSIILNNEDLIEVKADKFGKKEESPESDNNKYSYYLERIIKLIPSEVIGLYLALHSMGLGNGEFRAHSEYISNTYFNGIIIACFILVIISRVFGTKKAGYGSMSYMKTAQWSSVFISSISFIIWVYAMGHKLTFLPIDGIYIKASVFIWTFIVPYFYKGEKQQD